MHRRRPSAASVARVLPLAGMLTSLILASLGLPAAAAPLAAPSVGVIPASGPPGMSVNVIGSDWTPAPSNPPYIIFWESPGGTQLGTFSPNGSGSFSTSVTIPGGVSAGPHTIVACEGYGIEFQQCASTTFTATPATSTPSRTPTRTPSRTPTQTPLGYITPTFTRTATVYYIDCIDGIAQVSPEDHVDLGGVATTDLVLDVVLGDPTTQHVRVYLPGSSRVGEVYTRWPDPTPGTSVEAVADADEPNRWRVTVHDYPVRLGYNQILADIDSACGGYERRNTYFQFQNGIEPTVTPRPDACGGLGLPPEATILTFEGFGPEYYLEQAARDQGVRFEGSLRIIDLAEVNPRSGYRGGASIEGLEFGSAMLPIRMAFDRPLQGVGLFVGLEEAIWVSGEVRASLSAYGYRGGSTGLVLLGSDATSFPAAPTDVIHCLRFTAAEGDIIARALVEYTDTGGGSIAERRLIDDLTLVYAEAELPPDAPPVVEITAPADGSSLPGTTVNLRATIREDRELAEARYQIDGGAETAIGAAPSITDPASYFTGVNFSASLLSAGVPHILTITALDRAGHFASDSVTIIRPTPVPTIDIQAVKMEVVQVVQCLSNRHCDDNAVPMVQGKPTWARIYVRSEGGLPARPISGRLCRGRVTTCDTAYINPINTIVPDGDEDPTDTDRANLDASLNFILPPAWLTGDKLELTAFVNYEEENVDETRGDNNVVQAAVAVTPPRRLTVMFRSVTAEGLTAPSSEMFNLVDWLTRVFPVARITPIWRGPLPGNFDLSDSSGDNCGRTWNVLMDSLRRAYTWSGSGTGYLFGMVPEGVNTDSVGGCGEIPGRVASGIVTPGRRGGAVIAAQEFGHNFGRHHASRCGNADNPDGGFPTRDGRLDELGLDLVVRQPYPRVSSYDYMGYCGGQDNTWTSVYTYLALLGTLPVANVAPSGGHLASLTAADGDPVLVGGGQLSPEAFTLQHGFYRAALDAGIEDGLPVGPFTAQLLAADETVLFERDFGLIEMSNHEPTDSGTFQIILPDMAGASQIVFLYNRAEIGRVTASGNAPHVSMLEPAAGEDWGASGAHTIAWEASDADGDALRFNVQYSTDGGAAWSSIDVDLTGATSLSVDSADLPGGSLLFRVLASDGLNQSESATSSPVTVANKAPMIQLASPSEGDAFPAGEAVILRGYATDYEDIVLEDGAYRWSSDLDGDLGAGPTLWGIPLSAGSHQITLTVTDQSGTSVSQSVGITVGGETASPARRPPVALLLVLAGGVLLLASAAGIAIFLMRARRT